MAKYDNIDLTQLQSLQQQGEVQLVDIRDPEAFARGHIPGALRLHQGNLAQFMMEGEYDDPLVVICYHGISSQSAAEYLAEQGFEQVFSLIGGMEAWSKSGAEVEAG
ncbi:MULTISPECIES: thiosulfate sulfurtransferase GlpE [Ferrimonas]|uniref:thiosulfate sulfurtransferase GlpE n=1 Tax=Ferrimonas TaxID=44011 RepID=UPI0004092BF5|nr:MULTISPECIES: thiosulfate sulfurtransferase GlpE [Ferrimonas]USD37756.1 thiosulfate sulfurtransferase GlpE [Ferrimonas sp. SCSIO 43195]